MRKFLALTALALTLGACTQADVDRYNAFDYGAVPTPGVNPADEGFVKECVNGLWCHWVRYGTPRRSQSNTTVVIGITVGGKYPRRRGH